MKKTTSKENPVPVETTKEKPVTIINNSNILSQLQVSNLAFSETIIKKYFMNKVEYFQAAQISNNFAQWQALTSDSEVLNMVQGLKIEFSIKPVQQPPHWTSRFSPGKKLLFMQK